MSPEVFSTHGSDHPVSGTIEVSPVYEEDFLLGYPILITINDPDLDKDSTIIETFSVITSPSDPAYGFIGIAGMPVEEDYWGNDQPTGRIMGIESEDDYPIVWLPDPDTFPSNCSSVIDEIVFDSDFTMTETGVDTGIFTGTFWPPEWYCEGGDAYPANDTEYRVVYYDWQDVAGAGPIEFSTAFDIVGSEYIQSGIDYVTVENVRTVNAFGEPVSNINVGQQIQIAVDVTNIHPVDYDTVFSYIIQIRDQNGFTNYRAWISGHLTAGQSTSPALSWTPEFSGSHDVTVFFWESVDNPVPLADPVTTTIDVLGNNPHDYPAMASVSNEPGTVVQDGIITIGTEKASYNFTEIITISGHIEDYDGVSDVTLLIFNPHGNIIAFHQVSPNASGVFSVDELIGENYDIYDGMHTVRAYVGYDYAETSFEFDSSIPPEPAVQTYLDNLQIEQFASFNEIPEFALFSHEYQRYVSALHWQNHLKPLILELDRPFLQLDVLSQKLEELCSAVQDTQNQTNRFNSDGTETEEYQLANVNTDLQCGITNYSWHVLSRMNQGISLTASVAQVDIEPQNEIDNYPIHLENFQQWQQEQQDWELQEQLRAAATVVVDAFLDDNPREDITQLPEGPIMDNAPWVYPAYLTAVYWQDHSVPFILEVTDPTTTLEVLGDKLNQGCHDTYQYQETISRYNPDGTDNEEYQIAELNREFHCNLGNYPYRTLEYVMQGMSLQSAINKVDEQEVQWIMEEYLYNSQEHSMEQPQEQGPAPDAAFTVIIPFGTTTPGCHVDNTCHEPTILSIDLLDDVLWINDDNAAHTITSGSPTFGPTGEFDSSLIMPGAWYHRSFNQNGMYEYFCMLHPWALGAVIVGGVPPTDTELEPETVLNVSVAKNEYDLDEEISLSVSLTNIESNATVIVDVLDPAGNPVVTRSASVSPGSSESIQFRISDNFLTGNYKIVASATIDGNAVSGVTYFKIKSLYNQFQITSVQVTDQQGNPSTLTKGTLGYVKVTVTSDVNITTLITVNLFDAELTTLGVGSVRSTLSEGESEIILSFLIPSNASSGNAEIFANGFTDWISNGGVPLTGEFSTIEEII